MRTPEQIENLKRVLIMHIGPFAMLLSPEEINKWADRLQERINESTVCNWEIRIRTKDNESAEWDFIEPEPTAPRASISIISRACKDILETYPDAVSIQIRDREVFTHRYIFNKETVASKT